MENQIPKWLYNRIFQDYSKNIDEILKGFSSKRPVTFRVNTLKAKNIDIEEKLCELNIKFEKVPWDNNAFIVKKLLEKDIQELEIYNEGQIYLQSLSSMLPAIILNPKPNESILDMTAAPGSKTTQIACLSEGKALITACEKNKIRYERLKYNVEKQGAKKTTIIQMDARQLDEFFSFDKILLDAPCSGSGTININMPSNISEDLLNRSIKSQQELLHKAISIIKKGGEIIYSTCSILKEENEEIIKTVLDENIEIVPIDIEKFKEIPLLPTTINGTICIRPSELYEGFFIAKLKRIK